MSPPSRSRRSTVALVGARHGPSALTRPQEGAPGEPGALAGGAKSRLPQVFRTVVAETMTSRPFSSPVMRW
jgi:hypothetical protein